MGTVSWLEPEYLLRGNPRQQNVYRVLNALAIFNLLAEYNPVLVGTIPIAIDLATSDLDVICEVYDLSQFETELVNWFGDCKEFSLWRATHKLPSVIANFKSEGFSIEIFGQGRPVTVQNAYRHLIIEARVLALGNDSLQEEIRRLKSMGFKTEPAFAKILNLSGNPYVQLLQLEDLPDQELLALLPVRFIR